VRAGAGRRSLERAARDARYQAFSDVVGAGEVLLIGQHRDDQAETLLFRLLRGAGVQGLAAMPMQRALASGHLLRPLLGSSRAQLQAYAEEHQLTWVEDPSNADPRFSRNYLRHRVFPRLTERWPQAVASLARAAEHLSEAQGLLDELACLDLQTAEQPSPFVATLAVIGPGAVCAFRRASTQCPASLAEPADPVTRQRPLGRLGFPA
jgi:tRNA(Ile)-lysidine synthase